LLSAQTHNHFRWFQYIQFLLVRPTAFEKAASSDKSAPVEKLQVTLSKNTHSKFLSASETQSERPDLTAARGECSEHSTPVLARALSV
jgi:electron transfer flavoprotein alpha subunit